MIDLDEEKRHAVPYPGIEVDKTTIRHLRRLRLLRIPSGLSLKRSEAGQARIVP